MRHTDINFNVHRHMYQFVNKFQAYCIYKAIGKMFLSNSSDLYNIKIGSKPKKTYWKQAVFVKCNTIGNSFVVWLKFKLGLWFKEREWGHKMRTTMDVYYLNA